MDSRIEQISPVECRVHVEIPWDQVSKRLDQKMRDLGRNARLPGFRRGKVPRHMLERLYGKGVREELANDLVQETFQTAVVSHERNPLTQPVLESSVIEKGEGFKYAARFEVMPELEVKDYEGIEVRRRPAKVEDSAVEEALLAKQKELIEIRPLPEDIDRKATEAGDVWTLDVKGTFGDQEIERKDVRVEIGSTEGEFIPGIAKALESLELSEVGSSKAIAFTPPQENLRPEFKDLECKLTVGLREVKQKFVPPLDDELARDTGEAETLDELKAKIRADLLEQDQHQAELEARKRLVEALLERNEFTPAPSLIEREISAQVNLFERQLAAQGMNPAALGTNRQQLAANMRPQATFNVKAFLLLDALGKANDITVSDEELDKEVEEMAAEQGQNAARLRAQMERSQELLLLRAQMREERILDFLMEKAKVTEAPDPEPEAANASDDAASEQE